MKTKTTSHPGQGVAQFLGEHGADVTGVIGCFDRLRLARQAARWLYKPSGGSWREGVATATLLTRITK